MPEYVDLLSDIDPPSMEEEIYDSLRDRWPDWEPADGNLEVWIIKALTFRISEMAETAVDVADEIFASYGTMRGIPRFDPSPAVGESTWTFNGTDGYTIEAGIEVTIPVSGSDSMIFQVAEDTVVPAGETSASVPLIATDAGADGNGLTGNPTLVDALVWVQNITLDAPTTGGVDEEDISEYLERLTKRLRIASETPIVPADFETIAITYFTFVGRAVARDGYDPVTDTENNERMVALAVTDQMGEPLTPAQRSQVATQLEAMREVNFQVHVIDADYTTVDVEYEISPFPGYKLADVRAAVDSALTTYLSPAEWGRSQIAGSAAQFVLSQTLRYFELVALIDGVPGVDYLENLQIRKSGGSWSTTDLALTGAVPLTRPGVFS